MVYLSAFRKMRAQQACTVAPGVRLLMPTCSPGIDFLAGVNEGERVRLDTHGTTYAINASFSATVGLPASLSEYELGRKVMKLAEEVQAAWLAPAS